MRQMGMIGVEVSVFSFSSITPPTDPRKSETGVTASVLKQDPST